MAVFIELTQSLSNRTDGAVFKIDLILTFRARRIASVERKM